MKASKKVTANRPTINKQPGQTPTVAPPTSSPIPNQGDEMKKMLEDLFGGGQSESIPEVVKPVPQPVVAKPRQQKPAPAPHQMAHPKIISHAFDKTKSNIATAKPTVEKPQPSTKKIFAEPEVQEEVETNFDIRQAIIFSEILKRPQY